MTVTMQKSLCCFAAILVLALCTSATVRAQSRVNDKDLARMMQNVRDDAQPFSKNLANALKKSTIRGTSQEKDARRLADTFAEQAKRAADTFKSKRKAEDQVAAMVDTAGKIDTLVYSLNLSRATTTAWEKLRTELHQVAQAFHVPEPYFGESSASPPAETRSCLASAGAKRSAELVKQCLNVSPATHPPCNAQNACSMIVDEIKRGCAYIGQGAPAFCADYR